MDATKAIMVGGVAGLAGLLLLALPDDLQVAVAGEEPVSTLLKSSNDLLPPAFEPSDLVKWDYYVQPGISIEPIRESAIRKIGYGKTTMVNVMETESGIYSTDALASPHVEYPGIIKERKDAGLPLLRVWTGRQWTATAGVAANSFVSVTRFDNGALITTEDGNCAVIGPSVYC